MDFIRRSVRTFVVIPFIVAVLSVAQSPAQASDLVTASDAAACGIAADPAANTSWGADPETLPDDGSAWQTGSRRWTEEWEDAYSTFVRDQVKGDLLTANRLLASCTLWPTYVRAIFARVHNLPFLYIGGSRRVSHTDRSFRGPLLKWTEENWQRMLNEDERFRSFLRSLIGVVVSSNVPKNLYPIQVFKDGNQNLPSKLVRPGALITTSGHAKLISRIDPRLWYPVRGKSATMPTRPQLIAETSVMWSEPPHNWVAAWRWPVYCGPQGWTLRKGETMPGYSLDEQKNFPTSPAALEFKRRYGWLPLLGGYMDELFRSRSVTKPPRDTFELELPCPDGPAPGQARGRQARA